jgi:hypothetical protein
MADFLYNGVQLPELPDVEGYPYKYVFYHTLKSCYLVICREKAMTVSKGSQYGDYITADNMNKRYYLGGDKWVHINYGSVIFTGDIGSFKWANHTIYYSNGTDIYLDKSTDPVPVNPPEPTPLDPTSMLMGWLVGRAVASQRGKA